MCQISYLCPKVNESLVEYIRHGNPAYLLLVTLFFVYARYSFGTFCLQWSPVWPESNLSTLLYTIFDLKLSFLPLYLSFFFFPITMTGIWLNRNAILLLYQFLGFMVNLQLSFLISINVSFPKIIYSSLWVTKHINYSRF